MKETLVLALPADPELVRLTGIASTHFFRQNGLTLAAARRGARTVEKRCRPLLRAAARKGMPVEAALVLFLRPRSGALEVVGRAHGGSETCLVRLDRPDSA
jgi:hypothetical protein